MSMPGDAALFIRGLGLPPRITGGIPKTTRFNPCYLPCHPAHQDHLCVSTKTRSHEFCNLGCIDSTKVVLLVLPKADLGRFPRTSQGLPSSTRNDL